MRTWIVAFIAVLVGCSGTEPLDSSDAGSTPDFGGDIAISIDMGLAEDFGSAVLDVGTDASSADLGAPTDASNADVPLPGFGQISGDCDVLDDELMSTESFFFVNALDFGVDPYDDADLALLTDGGQEIIADGNAGGNSLLSEVFAYEMLARCEGAVLLKTETEVSYQNDMGKITDLLVEIDGLKIGVSVTRALAFPFEDPYTVQQAQQLLEDKLGDIPLSSANVSAEDAWTKQILHVLAYSPMHAESLRTAYDGLDPAVTADTVVIVTATNGDDAPLY